MKQEFTNKPRDMQWLRTGHLRAGNVRMADGKLNMAGPITGFLSAVIYGNDDSPDVIEVFPSDNPDLGAFCMTFKLDDDGLYRQLVRAPDPKVFEVVGHGYAGKLDFNRVMWVTAPSAESLQAALGGIKLHEEPCELVSVKPGTLGIDFVLPGDLLALRSRLQAFLNVKEAAK